MLLHTVTLYQSWCFRPGHGQPHVTRYRRCGLFFWIEKFPWLISPSILYAFNQSICNLSREHLLARYLQIFRVKSSNRANTEIILLSFICILKDRWNSDQSTSSDGVRNGLRAEVRVGGHKWPAEDLFFCPHHVLFKKDLPWAKTDGRPRLTKHKQFLRVDNRKDHRNRNWDDVNPSFQEKTARGYVNRKPANAGRVFRLSAEIENRPLKPSQKVREEEWEEKEEGDEKELTILRRWVQIPFWRTGALAISVNGTDNPGTFLATLLVDKK